MKAKSTSFHRSKVQLITQRVKQDGAQFLLRHSIIFAKLYERQASKKGALFAMKAKLTRFYVHKVELRLKQVKGRVTGWLAAAQAGLVRFKQRLAGLRAVCSASTPIREFPKWAASAA